MLYNGVMYILDPSNHENANRIWREMLSSKPNGARTLGTAVSKYLAPAFEPYYDMLITYASDIPFDIPKDVRKIAVIWHQNFPWAAGISAWRKVNSILYWYDVDYFCNEKKIVQLIRESGGKAHFMPRFIDTTTLPKPKKEKTIDTLWFGNRWNEFRREFVQYQREVKTPYWLSHNIFGNGEEELYEVDRTDALKILNDAKTVWAIGISQLEAQYLGAEVHSYRGDVLPFYDQNTIKDYVARLLLSIRDQRAPKF